MPYLGYRPPGTASMSVAQFPARTLVAWIDGVGSTVYTMPVSGWPVAVGAVNSLWFVNPPGLGFFVSVYDASSGAPGGLVNWNSTAMQIAGGAAYRQSTGLASFALMPAGTKYALAINTSTETATWGMWYLPSSGNFIQFNKTPTGGAPIPTHPFYAGGSYALGAQTAMFAIWLEYIANRPPNAPIEVAVNGDLTGPVESLTFQPVFSFKFSDPDLTAGYPEKIGAYEFEVTDVASGLVIWPLAGDPGSATRNATTAEQAPNVTISTQYPGSTSGSGALISGANYLLRIRTRDLAGDWRAYSAPFAFSIAQVGGITLNANPTGKIDGPTDAISFQGRWNHPSNTPTSHVQVEVLRAGAQWQLGPEVAQIVASSALPGTLFTINNALDGIDPLPRGDAFTYRMRARAGGVLTNWRGQRAFSTNAPPNIPAPFSPIDGAVTSASPLLTWATADPDEDDIMGADVVWTVRLTRPSPLTTLTFQSPATAMTFDLDTGMASLPLTTTHCPSPGTYVWDVQADDLSASALLANYGKSAFSDAFQFTLTTGPQPTLTLPATTVNTVAPLYRFTVANGPHTAYRIVVYRAGTLTRVWDSQRVNSTAFDVVQPAGFLSNGVAYDVEATVWNAAEAQGISARRKFTVVFTQPDAIQNLVYAPYRASRDTEPTTVQLGWDPTNLPGSEFLGYVIRRFRLNQEIILFPVITNRAQTRFWDWHAPPNEPMTYTVSQLRRAGTSPGAQAVEGPTTEILIELQMGVIVIATTFNPADERFVLTYEPASISEQLKQNLQPYVTWGSQNKPVIISTPGTQNVWNINGILITDDFATRRSQAEAAKRIIEAQSTVCVRHNDGRVFGKILDFRRQVGTGFDPDTVTFTIEETNYQEGL